MACNGFTKFLLNIFLLLSSKSGKWEHAVTTFPSQSDSPTCALFVEEMYNLLNKVKIMILLRQQRELHNKLMFMNK